MCLWGVLLWRQLKGCRVLPAGFQGCPLRFLFFSRRLRRRAKREKEVFRRHPEPRQRAAALCNLTNDTTLPTTNFTPNPGKGRLPFAIPHKNRSVDAKGVSSMCFSIRELWSFL